VRSVALASKVSECWQLHYSSVLRLLIASPAAQHLSTYGSHNNVHFTHSNTARGEIAITIVIAQYLNSPNSHIHYTPWVLRITHPVPTLTACVPNSCRRSCTECDRRKIWAFPLSIAN